MSTSSVISKVQFTVWRPLLESLRILTEEACLRRDAYLAKVLAHEIEVLAAAEGQNTDLARNYLNGALKSLDCQMATFTLPDELIGRINQVCSDKRLHRDCFFNRVLLLILPRDQRALYDWLYSDGDISAAWQEAVTDIDSPAMSYQVLFSRLHAIRAGVNSDPLGLIREVIEVAGEKNIGLRLEDPLLMPLHPGKRFNYLNQEYDVAGFNVLLPDAYIRGSADHIDLLI